MVLIESISKQDVKFTEKGLKLTIQKKSQ
ncbi:hypothetical protein, partial [Plasmodium yoelii yoelii]